MNAVATITPDPKYLATKDAHDGNLTRSRRVANTGSQAPNMEPTKMTKIALIRTRIPPLYPVSVSQIDIAQRCEFANYQVVGRSVLGCGVRGEFVLFDNRLEV